MISHFKTKTMQDTKQMLVSITEINTMTLPGDQGIFMMGVEGFNEETGEQMTMYLEFDFGHFYSWIDEDDIKKMKQAYAKKFLKL